MCWPNLLASLIRLLICSLLMDAMIDTALKKHKKERAQNFIFDRIKAISSETKRINHNLDIGD